MLAGKAYGVLAAALLGYSPNRVVEAFSEVRIYHPACREAPTCSRLGRAQITAYEVITISGALHRDFL